VAVIRILFGVTSDGGGLGLTPGGKPVPVDPWGPLHQVAPAQRDVLLGLAITELAKLAHSPAAHDEIKKVGSQVMHLGMEKIRR